MRSHGDTFQDLRRKKHTRRGPTARSSYEHYMALARQSVISGDAIETESLYQHADHYFRVMKKAVAE
jgi:hypothetical protein